VQRQWPYAFDYFDNAVKIPELARRLYSELGKRRGDFPDPFATGSSNSFFAWLNEAVDSEQESNRRITRLWYEIYKSRPDVQSTYPDVFGADRDAFLEWILSSGRYEHPIDKALVPHRYSDLLPLDLNGAEKHLPLGVNVVGYVSSEKGTGEGARCSIRALKAIGIPFVVNNILDPGSAGVDGSVRNFSHENPFSINLLHVNSDQVPFVAKQKGAQFFRGRYNIGYWTWELSEFPAEWHSSFSYFDELWVPTNFVLDAVSRVSPVPVLRMPLALPFESIAGQKLPRKHFGLPEDEFIFLFIFDFHSFLERKNPSGLIEAFKRAFSNKDDTLLVLKTSHSSTYPQQLRKLHHAARGANCTIFDKVLPRDEVNELMRNCDCYISLHRSEGFGSTAAEAMSMGKPVIATGYSGNMDFMNHENSFLVKYRLVEIQEDHGPYRKGMQWADPDIDHAARLMRLVYENRNVAAETGEKASHDMRRYLSAKSVGKLVRERLLNIASDGKFHMSPDKFVLFSNKRIERPT